MKKIFLLFLIVSNIVVSQNKIVFDHFSTSNCYNSYMNVTFKTITYSNSNKNNLLIVSIKNQKITSVVLWLVDENIQYNYNIEEMLISNFKPEIHLKNFSKRVLEINNSGFKYFDKIESENEGIKKTIFKLYKSKRKKMVVNTIEVESYSSTSIQNHKISFGHSNLFFNYNKINFYPYAIKSYKRYKNKNLLESCEIEEIGKTDFTINLLN